jgi:hypothetical protein
MTNLVTARHLLGPEMTAVRAAMRNMEVFVSKPVIAAIVWKLLKI